MVADVANLSSADLEELCMLALSTLEKLWRAIHSSLLQNFCEKAFVENWIFHHIAKLQEGLHQLGSYRFGGESVGFGHQHIAKLAVGELEPSLLELFDIQP